MENSEVEKQEVEGEKNHEIKVPVGEGDTVEDVAQKMVSAWKPGSFVSAVYDKVRLTAGGGHSPEDIVAKYEAAKAKEVQE